MSRKTVKRRKKQLKKATVIIIAMSALLLLDGLAFAAWRLWGSMPHPEPTPAPTAEPTVTPEPTPEPEPVYAGGYFVCEDGLFYPERTLTRAELADALTRAAGESVSLPGEGSEELTGARLRAALTALFPEERVDAAMGRVWMRGGESVTRAEAAVILNALLAPESDGREGVFPDVEGDYWAAEAIALAGRSEKTWDGGEALPAPGFLWVDGWLYCVQDDGYFLKNGWLGSLYFTPTGRYTSGSYELDGYVAAAIAANTDDSMTREERLRAMYLYVRDSFEYLRRHYYKIGDTGWALEEATTMYATGKGNCYCYAGAFWAAARGLGYDAKIVSGTYGKEKAPHGWVEIFLEDGRHTYDVEIEMVQRRDGNTNGNMYALDESERRGHGYIELATADDLAPRETNEGLQPA